MASKNHTGKAPSLQNIPLKGISSVEFKLLLDKYKRSTVKFQETGIEQGKKSRKLKLKSLEQRIEKNTQYLLDAVDYLVELIRNMNIGPSALDSFRYDIINTELLTMHKVTAREEARGEELSNFQMKQFRSRLEAAEKEIIDVYVTWMQHYGATLQDVIHQCQELVALLNSVKKLNKKQKDLQKNITEFLSYALAQKNSVYRLQHEKIPLLPLVTNTKEVFERIETLQIRLNTPLPISFGNLPKTTADAGDSKKGKKTKKVKEKKKGKGEEENENEEKKSNNNEKKKKAK